MGATAVCDCFLQRLACCRAFRIKSLLPLTFLIGSNHFRIGRFDVGRSRRLGADSFLHLMLGRSNCSPLHLLLDLIVVQGGIRGIETRLSLVKLRLVVRIVEFCHQLAGMNCLIIIHV